jgi:hypothetical protein
MRLILLLGVVGLVHQAGPMLVLSYSVPTYYFVMMQAIL